MDRWTDRVVLVTGASSGIGKSIVTELSKYPLKIVALDRKTDQIQVSCVIRISISFAKGIPEGGEGGAPGYHFGTGEYTEVGR